MYLLGELAFQLFLLVHVQIGGFDGLQYPVVDVGIPNLLKSFAAVLVVQRHGGLVFHGALEVVHGNVAAEGAFGEVVVAQKRRAGEADARGRGEQAAHIVGKLAVLTAVRLVRHDYDVVIRQDGVGVGLVELVDERKDEAGVAPQFLDEVGPAGGDGLRGCDIAEYAAVLERAAYLGVEFFAVGEHHEGGRALELAANLLGEEEHGIAFAAALRMPEHAQLAAAEFAVGIGAHGLVHAEVLMVAGEDFCCSASGVVEKNEVFQEVEEVFLAADAAKHDFQCHASGLAFFKAFPFVEELVLTA